MIFAVYVVYGVLYFLISFLSFKNENGGLKIKFVFLKSLLAKNEKKKMFRQYIDSIVCED